MICERCGCHDRVMRTEREGNVTYRIRRCPKCGNQQRTEEKPIRAAEKTDPVVPEEPGRSVQPQSKKKGRSRKGPTKGALADALSSAK